MTEHEPSGPGEDAEYGVIRPSANAYEGDQEPDHDAEHVTRSDVGASIELDLTRGTGTRDQEKWKLKGKGESAEDALRELETMLTHVVGTDFQSVNRDGEETREHVERPMGDRIRAFQPENGGGE